MTKSLLLELGTEELPPKSLQKLAASLFDNFIDQCQRNHLNFNINKSQWFATPRRLAILIVELDEFTLDQTLQRKGPSVDAGFDANGNPTRAALGFAKSCSVDIDQLERLTTPKGEWLVYNVNTPGVASLSLVEQFFNHAVSRLPIAKNMRWGNSETQFVRPVHWVFGMFGEDILKIKCLGLDSIGHSWGHRFHHPDAVYLKKADDYAAALEAAHVRVNFQQRRLEIRTQVNKLTEFTSAKAILSDPLLDEVTALVEWPHAIVGNFDPSFLQIPQEALISSMEAHQKFFHLVDENDSLLPSFIAISNIDSQKPERMVAGFERVIRPRLADAQFFWSSDCKVPLENRYQRLNSVVFQRKLGTLADKTDRMVALCKSMALHLTIDSNNVERAAYLSKCDLLTLMVGEFPDLQGTMGKYYALVDEEATVVANALEEQYLPKFSGDSIPSSKPGKLVSIADRIDTLCGIFSIGLLPTGNKDPYALRRAAIGILRIIIEGKLDLDINQLISQSLQLHKSNGNVEDTLNEIYDFMMDRLKIYYLDQDVSASVIQAVMIKRISNPIDFDARIRACMSFSKLDESSSLAAANKRIRNILKKSNGNFSDRPDSRIFTEDAEIALFNAINSVEVTNLPLMQQRNYESTLKNLAQLKEPVDRFFLDVMVMVEDDSIRKNRLSLLNYLFLQFLQIADVSVMS